MQEKWASEFNDILFVLENREDIRKTMLRLIAKEPIHHKALSNTRNLKKLRDVLRELVEGKLILMEAVKIISRRLPRENMLYSEDEDGPYNGWTEALVRLHLSRFFNQAVMEILLSRGVSRIYVPHSSNAKATSPCALELAGKGHFLNVLYERLISVYSEGRETDLPKIPQHPYCNHVIKPFKEL